MFKIKNIFLNLYKQITYKIFVLIYGKINAILEIEEENDLDLEKIKIQNDEYKIYCCKTSRLYTDRVHDTAIIKTNSIINGPSFQYRNNINAECKVNSVFTKGTPRLKKKLKGKVFSLLTGGGGNTNYWHWLFDVLPRIHILNKSKLNNLEIDYYLLPNLERKFQNETLDMLKIPKKKRLSSKNFRHFSADEIISTTHPYTLLNDPLKDSLNIPIWIIEFLRKNFLLNNENQTKNKKFPNKIFINRKDANSTDAASNRFIINQKEVMQKLEDSGFRNLSLSDYSFSEQVDLFQNAKYIVGLHGAGFANIVFCKPDTKILEFKPINAGDMYKNLAIKCNLNYNEITSKPKTINYNFQNASGDIEVDLDLLNKTLEY